MPDPHVFRTFAEFLQSIEDGQFHQDISDKLTEINSVLTNHILDHGGKPGANLTIKLKFKADKGIVAITPELDVSLPKAPRGQATMWQTEKGFTPFNPKQVEMFQGQPRVVADDREIREV